MRRILYAQYTNPAGYPPLEHSSRILAGAGWKVMFLGTGALGADALRFPAHRKILVRQMPFCRPGWRQKLHYLQFCLWVLAWTLRWRPHWIYASDLLACPPAFLLILLPGVRVLYHEHDSPGLTADSAFMRFCLAARTCLARRAELCILPNRERAERFATQMGNKDRVVCVWNCPERDEAALAHSPRTTDDLWLLYHGSIVPSRLPPAVLTAMAMLPECVKLRIVGYETVGHPGFTCQLKVTARALGIERRLDVIGPVPTRRELIDWCRRSDVGIALMPLTSGDDNEKSMAGASNKPFDYLACGLALLVSDLPEWRELYVDPGYGLACNPDDPESIAAALRWFLDHRGDIHTMGERGRQRVRSEWNYERQFAPVLDRMAGAAL